MVWVGVGRRCCCNAACFRRMRVQGIMLATTVPALAGPRLLALRRHRLPLCSQSRRLKWLPLRPPLSRRSQRSCYRKPPLRLHLSPRAHGAAAHLLRATRHFRGRLAETAFQADHPPWRLRLRPWGPHFESRPFRTALCTTTCKNLATVLRGHACTESVCVDTTALTWLIRTLHDFTAAVLFFGLNVDGKYTTDQLIFVTPGGNGWF